MSALRPIIITAAVLIACLMGWLVNPEARVANLPVVSARLAVPSVPQPGASLGASAAYFNQIHPPPLPPPKPAPPLKPAPLPKPDIRVVFRREVSAVVEEAPTPGGAKTYAVVLISQRPSVTHFRRLHVGDAFDDGWRLAALTPQAAELKRKAETAVIGFYGPLAAPPTVLGRPAGAVAEHDRKAAKPSSRSRSSHQKGQV